MFDEKNIEILKDKLEDIIHYVDPLTGRIDQKNLLEIMQDGVIELRLALKALKKVNKNSDFNPSLGDDDIPF